MSAVSERALDAARAVLAMCAAHDPWFPQPSEATILAWAQQIGRTGFTRGQLVAGVVDVYAVRESGFHPLPADVINAARAVRRDQLDRADPDDRPMRDVAVPEPIAELAAAKAIPAAGAAPLDPDRVNGRIVKCPYCRAGIGNPCVSGGRVPAHDRRVTGAKAMRGYHPSRIEAAKTAQEGAVNSV